MFLCDWPPTVRRIFLSRHRLSDYPAIPYFQLVILSDTLGGLRNPLNKKRHAIDGPEQAALSQEWNGPFQ